MHPFIRDALEYYIRKTYDAKGSFPHEVPVPTQIFAYVSLRRLTWNAREVLLIPYEHEYWSTYTDERTAAARQMLYKFQRADIRYYGNTRLNE